jgi:hypothetical protein
MLEELVNLDKKELHDVLDIIWVVFMICIFVFAFLAIGYYMFLAADPVNSI